MKKMQFQLFTVLISIATLLCIGCGNGGADTTNTSADSVTNLNRAIKSPSISAKFGSAALGCTGKGICNHATEDCYGRDIPITFACDTTANGTVQVSINFKLSQDTILEKMQAANWRDPNQAYPFDCPYSVSQDNPVLATIPGWNLPAGTIIPPGENATVAFDQGTGFITLTYATAISVPVQANVIFGGLHKGIYDQSKREIMQCSNDPIPAKGNIPASMPVTFTMSAVDAGLVLMSFNAATMQALYPQQWQHFSQPHTTYKFETAFTFQDAIFSSLMLTSVTDNFKALIPADSVNPFSNVGGIITDTIRYTTNILGTVLPCPPVTGLTCGASTSSSIQLSWSDPASIGGVKVYYRLANTSDPWIKARNLKFGIETCTISGLVPDTAYETKIESLCSYGTVYSDHVTCSTKP